jgi:hypothetical protein
VGHAPAFRCNGANSIAIGDAVTSGIGDVRIVFSHFFSLRNIQIIQSLELSEQGFSALPNSLCLPCPRASAAILPHFSQFFSSKKITRDSTT